MERVPCRHDPSQSYALYLPSSFKPDRPWPILYCLDPAARGAFPVQRFLKAAEAEGVIVAGSNNSRNGPMQNNRIAIEAMWLDTHTRFPIDEKRVYAAGHSGGARMALLWGQGGSLAGVIAGGAGFGSPDPPRKLPFALFFTAGSEDFNYFEIYSQGLALTKAGAPYRFSEFEGGHEWIPESLTLEALQYVSGRLPERPVEDSKETRRLAADFQRRAAEFAQADTPEQARLASSLRKRAAEPAPSTERRLARMVLAGSFIGAMEQAREFRDQRQFSRAVESLEVAVLLRPDNPNAWYSLAVAHAAAGQKRRALDALEKAAANGFTAWDRAAAEPLLQAVRSDKRYQTIAAQR
jgi:hypothetical protein